MTTDNTPGQSAKNAHYPEPDYTHPDEMPIVEQRPNPHSDLRGTIVHFTSEMLDNPDNYGIYPTTNFYNDLEEAILDWHNKQIDKLKAIRVEQSKSLCGCLMCLHHGEAYGKLKAEAELSQSR